MSTPAEKAKKLLHDKLQSAESIVNRIMTESSLTPKDEIAALFTNIQERLKGIGISDDVELTQLEDVYVNLIVGVMSQDMLESDDEIKRLTEAIGKRIENFDQYFEQLEKGTLDGPF
jgi:signal transduction protein with GAF and PtsI domain